MARTQPAPRATHVPDLRKGDQVLVLTGKDAGKRGTVERLDKPERVLIEGINIAKKHTKAQPPRPDRAGRMPKAQQGGILEIARPVHASNVMIVCRACDTPTRVRHQRAADGRSVRICRHCGETLTRVEDTRS